MGNNIPNFLAGENKNQNNMPPVEDFEFHDLFSVETANGLYINGIFLPEEVLTHILSFVKARDLLKFSRVCKWWCNIIKSDQLWHIKYHRAHPKKKAKKLPWYVYYSYFATKNFDTNFIRNGNGEHNFLYWKIMKNGGHGFKIEETPVGTDPLPLNIDDFNNCFSCFTTSFDSCWKYQLIPLEVKRLLRYIMNKYMPHIYASEWIATRFDCGGRYTLTVRGFEKQDDISDDTLQKSVRVPDILNDKFSKHEYALLNPGQNWHKKELIVDDYPLNVGVLIFEHRGKDTQFWAGHYGTKMAGGVLKLLFDTIEPLAEGELNKIRKEQDPDDNSRNRENHDEALDDMVYML